MIVWLLCCAQLLLLCRASGYQWDLFFLASSCSRSYYHDDPSRWRMDPYHEALCRCRSSRCSILRRDTERCSPIGRYIHPRILVSPDIHSSLFYATDATGPKLTQSADWKLIHPWKHRMDSTEGGLTLRKSKVVHGRGKTRYATLLCSEDIVMCCGSICSLLVYKDARVKRH